MFQTLYFIIILVALPRKKSSIHREITPLKENDCFVVFNRKRNAFTFPIHFHPEFEINYIKNAKGGRRVVGDHIDLIGEKELVMVGPNLYHGWQNFNNNTNNQLHEITIQFSKELFSENVLDKNILKPIKELLSKANQGILFSQETVKEIEKLLFSLNKNNGFESFLDFQMLLYKLAISTDTKLLTNISFQQKNDFHNSKRIEIIYNYITENYKEKIKLNEMAEMVNMTVISFGRLIKQRTGKPFIDFVNEVRLGYATRDLIETTKSVAEICYDSGFNNLSNFNRLFKKRQGTTPSEFRNKFSS